MKRKHRKQWLSILLSVVMLFTSMAIPAATIPSPAATQMEEDHVTGDIIATEELNTTQILNLYSKSKKNEDGTYTMEVFDVPIKYMNANGVVKDKLLGLKETASSYVTRQSDIVCSFPKTMSAGISLTYGDSVITMVPDIANNIVKTQHKDGVVSYLTDTKTLYQYSLTYMGYKEDIIVPDYTGQTEYSFTYYTNGLHMDVIDDELVVKDTDGNIIAGFSEVIVFTADDLNNTFGEYRCETIEKNKEYRVTIVLDAEYLADERTAYPIVIDPSLEVNADMGTSAIEDATINSTAGTSPNGTSIFVGKRSTKGIARMLVRFPGLDLSTFSSASNIISAKYILRDLMCYSTHLPVEAHVFQSAWSESNVTWTSTNPDNYVSATLDTQTVFYRNGNYISAGSSYSNSYAFDITNAVRGWKSGTYNPAAGFILKTTSAIETGSENISVCFASFERSSNKPRLIIEYIDPPSATISHTAITIDKGSSFQLGITSTSAVSVYWMSMNPAIATVNINGLVTGVAEGTTTVRATVTDADGASAYYYCAVSVGTTVPPYYLNNRYYGRYLHRSGSINIDTASGLFSVLGNSVLWKMTCVNGNQYTIQPVNDLSKYLFTGGGTSAWLYSPPALSDNCKWTVTTDPQGGVLIQNVATGTYLTMSDTGAVSVTASTGTSGSPAYSSCCWRKADTNYVSGRELSSTFSIKKMFLLVGETKHPTIQPSPSLALWSTSDDFTYEIINTSGYTGSVTMSGDNFTGVSLGLVRVRARHKVTGRTKLFDIEVYKKAIFVLPGIMGSAIYAKEDFEYTDILHITHNITTGDIMWDPPTSLADVWEVQIPVYALEMNQYGTPVYPVGVGMPIINNNVEPDRRYGALGTYKNIYLRLCDEFADTHDVILYEYDWRFDPYDTAVDLADYIEDHYYSEVVFVSHSMGGIVSSYYLALGETARDRVDKHISIGTPYLGAEKLAYVYDTGDAIDSYFKIFGYEIPLFDKADLIKPPIQQIMPNIPSVYALLPFDTNFSPYLQIKDSDGVTTLQTTSIATTYMLSTHLSRWNGQLYNSAKSHQNLLFVNNMHVTQLVDSYYIVGGDENTPQTLQIRLDDSGQKQGQISINAETLDGDGTVSLRSALISGALSTNILCKYSSDNISATHVGMISGNDDQKTFDYICDVISDINVNLYTNTEFFNRYSGYKEVQ